MKFLYSHFKLKIRLGKFMYVKKVGKIKKNQEKSRKIKKNQEII
jgi:hypothetical protein